MRIHVILQYVLTCNNECNDKQVSMHCFFIYETINENADVNALINIKMQLNNCFRTICHVDG